MSPNPADILQPGERLTLLTRNYIIVCTISSIRERDQHCCDHCDHSGEELPESSALSIGVRQWNGMPRDGG